MTTINDWKMTIDVRLRIIGFISRSAQPDFAQDACEAIRLLSCASPKELFEKDAFIKGVLLLCAKSR